MRSFKIILVTMVIIIILILGLTGCWNRRELPNLGIVMGVGMDKTDDTDELEVTTQIIKTSELKSGSPEGSSGSSGSGSGAYWNVKNTGDSMFTTIRDFTHKTSRKLYWPHNQIIIFGHSLAEEGVEEYLDFFVRDQETRLEVYVLVAQNKASDVFDVKPRLEKVPAVGIAELMDSQDANSQTTVIQLNQFITRLMSPTTAPIAPIIEIRGKDKDEELFVSGTAVFKKDKLVGQMNKSETRGLLWTIDEIKSGIIEVKCPDCESIVNMEIIRSKSKITSKIIDNKPHITIEVKEEGNIGSQTCPANLVSPDAVKELEKQTSEAIISEIMSALKKAKKLKADIFGFGEIFHKKHPQVWQEMREDWDEIFSDLEVEIVVEAKIRRSGTIGRPATKQKEQ